MREFDWRAAQASNELPYAFKSVWNDNVPLPIAKKLIELLIHKHKLDLNRFTLFADHLMECIEMFYDMNPRLISAE